MRKRFGQHFLEQAWVDKLIRAVQPSSDDTFLEIGPGRGALTVALAPLAGRVIAVEIDRTRCLNLNPACIASAKRTGAGIKPCSTRDR